MERQRVLGHRHLYRDHVNRTQRHSDIRRRPDANANANADSYANADAYTDTYTDADTDV